MQAKEAMALPDVHPLTSVLAHARRVVDECIPTDLGRPREGDTWKVTPDLQERLSSVLFAVLSTGRSLSGQHVQKRHAADLWHIICKVWVSHHAQALPYITVMLEHTVLRLSQHITLTCNSFLLPSRA